MVGGYVTTKNALLSKRDYLPDDKVTRIFNNPSMKVQKAELATMSRIQNHHLTNFSP